MTTRTPRPPRTRLLIAATAAALLAGTLSATAAAGPAQAAVPAAAQTWTTLMYRSLTPGPQDTQLQATLAAQQVTFATRVAAVAAAKKTNVAAQAQLTTASAADATARTAYTAARTALTSADKTHAQALAQRPRNAATVTRATTAVTTATTTTATRKTAAQQAAATLKTAGTRARSATTALDTAIAGWKTASVALQLTRQKIAARTAPAILAGQAAALSRDVVTQVRATFATGDTTVVYGITVHRSVAFAVKRMLDDAKAGGIVLSGGGFRTKQRQIELRTINGCPDVWTAPASSCRVPTAIPGRSLHEIGLAIDITAGGRTITAQTPAFRWLAANAARYGFVNLPSEAWHWSITGG